MFTTEIIEIIWNESEGQIVSAEAALLASVPSGPLIINGAEKLEWNRENDPDRVWSEDLETRNQEFRDWAVTTEQYQLALANLKLRLLGPDAQDQP